MTDSFKLACHTRGFIPVASSLQVWNGPRQSVPCDDSKRVDLAMVLPALDLPGSRGYKGDLYPAISNL